MIFLVCFDIPGGSKNRRREAADLLDLDQNALMRRSYAAPADAGADADVGTANPTIPSFCARGLAMAAVGGNGFGNRLAIALRGDAAVACPASAAPQQRRRSLQYDCVPEAAGRGSCQRGRIRPSPSSCLGQSTQRRDAPRPFGPGRAPLPPETCSETPAHREFAFPNDGKAECEAAPWPCSETRPSFGRTRARVTRLGSRVEGGVGVEKGARDKKSAKQHEKQCKAMLKHANRP